MQVIDKYVDPLVGHLKSMLSYRKFRKGLKEEVDDMLRAEKSENPMRISIVLAYLMNIQARLYYLT